MHIVAIVLSLVLAAAMLGTGVLKLVHAPGMVRNMESVNVTRSQMTVLGVIDVAATVGLVVGLFWAPLAIAAAVGAVVYFVGAIVAHVRAHDRGVQGAVALLVLSVATLVFLLITL